MATESTEEHGNISIRKPLINYLAVIPANAGIQRFQQHGFRPAPGWRSFI